MYRCSLSEKLLNTDCFMTQKIFAFNGVVPNAFENNCNDNQRAWDLANCDSPTTCKICVNRIDDIFHLSIKKSKIPKN